MIKWDGFGKLLKLSFFTLLISCFGGLGSSFVNGAEKWQMVGLDYSNSVVDSNYEITALQKGTVLTRLIGSTKSVLAVNGNNIFWFAPNGFPYMYITNGGTYTNQGYFKGFEVCGLASLSGNYVRPSGCSWIDGIDKEVLKNFFSSITSGDILYYNYGAGSDNQGRWDISFRVCFSSESLNRSICFRDACDYNGTDTCGSNFSGSMSFSDLTFSSLSTSNIGYFPGQAGYGGGGNIDGSSTNVSNSPITGDVMTSTCTRQRALNFYQRNGYSEKMCFASYNNNSDIFQGAGTVSAYALTGESIIDVWFDTWNYRRSGNTGYQMDYSQWLSYWRNTYEVYQRNSETYTNPFLGVPVSIFTLMGNIDVYGKPYTNESIIDYCNLLLLETPLSNPYEGVYSSQICSQSALDILADTVGLHAESGQVVEGSSWDGITNRPGMHNPPVGNGGTENGSSSGGSGASDGLNSFQDGLTFQNGVFNLLKGTYKFPRSTGSNGVLPSYIIIFLCVLVFFRFISH